MIVLLLLLLLLGNHFGDTFAYLCVCVCHHYDDDGPFSRIPRRDGGLLQCKELAKSPRLKTSGQRRILHACMQPPLQRWQEDPPVDAQETKKKQMIMMMMMHFHYLPSFSLDYGIQRTSLRRSFFLLSLVTFILVFVSPFFCFLNPSPTIDGLRCGSLLLLLLMMVGRLASNETLGLDGFATINHQQIMICNIPPLSGGVGME
uniref:Secreted protein n=1 Tax=Anopheles darlingi TaxID=43151 RepID=A0A2M4D785_ANODA